MRGMRGRRPPARAPRRRASAAAGGRSRARARRGSRLQMRTRSRRAACDVAAAEGQAHADARLVGHRHDLRAPGPGRPGGARACRRRTSRRAPSSGARSRSLRPDQRGAQLGQRRARLVQRGAQVAQQAAQRRLAVERQRRVVLGRGDAARRPDRLAALRDARHQRHVLREGHARQRRPANTPSATWQRAVARRGQAAEQVAGGGALGSFRRSSSARSGVAGSACTSAL